jgi:hypothetical protein
MKTKLAIRHVLEFRYLVKLFQFPVEEQCCLPQYLIAAALHGLMI